MREDKESIIMNFRISISIVVSPALSHPLPFSPLSSLSSFLSTLSPPSPLPSPSSSSCLLPPLVLLLRHFKKAMVISPISTVCIYEIFLHNHCVIHFTPETINNNSVISHNAQAIFRFLPPPPPSLFFSWFIQVRKIGMQECCSITFFNRK